MFVRELIRDLQLLPDDLEVVVAVAQSSADFPNGFVGLLKLKLPPRVRVVSGNDKYFSAGLEVGDRMVAIDTTGHEAPKEKVEVPARGPRFTVRAVLPRTFAGSLSSLHAVIDQIGPARAFTQDTEGNCYYTWQDLREHQALKLCNTLSFLGPSVRYENEEQREVP